MDHHTVTLDRQTLVDIEDSDFGLLDGLRIEKAHGTTVVLKITDDEVLASLIAAAIGLQGLRRMRSRSCGHSGCGDVHGHVDTCVHESAEALIP